MSRRSAAVIAHLMLFAAFALAVHLFGLDPVVHVAQVVARLGLLCGGGCSFLLIAIAAPSGGGQS